MNTKVHAVADANGHPTIKIGMHSLAAICLAVAQSDRLTLRTQSERPSAQRSRFASPARSAKVETQLSDR